jgi:glycosyltransferase involved in cell wall biosynthesis
MIDLIIPYYNNPEGLIQTLNSINTNVFKITIVDDGSNDYLPPQLMAA